MPGVDGIAEGKSSYFAGNEPIRFMKLLSKGACNGS